MVTLEDFKKYMNHITGQMAKDDVLSDVLVCEDTTGWVSTAAELIDDVITLVADNFNGEESEEWISWWLWEIDRDKPAEERNNHVWIDDKDAGVTYRYTIEDLDDLYYLITGELKNIKNYEEDEMPDLGVQPTVDHPNFTGETLYDVFMRSMDGYTESDN